MTETQQPQSSLILSIRNFSKGVPYYGSGLRPDGSENHGFKPLKGHTDDVALIPEAQDNSALRNALLALNGQATPFFTLGCEKSCNQDKSGYWMRGFLELSFNYTELVLDAQRYFKLFFDFNHWFWEQAQEATVEYHFQLEGASFMNISVNGFTVVVWITTVLVPTAEDAQKAWAWALDTLVTFLMSIAPNPALRGHIY
jgi:hypothetical protein